MDREHRDPKLLPFRLVLRYDLSWEASNILGFSKVLKIQSLDMRKSTSVLTGLSKLFSVSRMYCMYHNRIQKQEFLCQSVFDGLLQKVSKCLSLMHQLGHSQRLVIPFKSWCGWCITVAPFSQGCPRVAVFSFAREH